jgi:hypothetical protein
MLGERFTDGRAQFQIGTISHIWVLSESGNFPWRPLTTSKRWSYTAEWYHHQFPCTVRPRCCIERRRICRKRSARMRKRGNVSPRFSARTGSESYLASALRERFNGMLRTASGQMRVLLPKDAGSASAPDRLDADDLAAFRCPFKL